MVAAIHQRREQIMALAYKQRYVSVRHLAEQIGASQATIRRDIHILAAQGQLELTHGGATLIRNSDYSFNSKSMRNIEAKKQIARMASGLVQDGDQIFLDSGTTCFAMTEHLRVKRALSVIVNSIRIAQELRAAGLNILILGGQFRPEPCRSTLRHIVISRVGSTTPLVTCISSQIAPTANIADSGGLMIAENSSTPNMPRFVIVKIPWPIPSSLPLRAFSISSLLRWASDFSVILSASSKTGTVSPSSVPTAIPMFTEGDSTISSSQYCPRKAGCLATALAQAIVTKSLTEHLNCCLVCWYTSYNDCALTVAFI